MAHYEPPHQNLHCLQIQLHVKSQYGKIHKDLLAREGTEDQKQLCLKVYILPFFSRPCCFTGKSVKYSDNTGSDQTVQSVESLHSKDQFMDLKDL